VFSQRRKGNRRRHLQLESLEGRELLSTALAPARPAAEVSPLAKTSKGEVLNGWFDGPGVWTPLGKFRGKNTLTASGELTSLAADGSATPMGGVTFGGSVLYKTAVQNNGIVGNAVVGYNLTNGIGTLTAANGDKLNLHFTGTYYESGTTYGLAWTGVVKGGTGKFRGADGSFNAWGTYNVATGALQVPSITVALTRK
jgi:hypothetical protein